MYLLQKTVGRLRLHHHHPRMQDMRAEAARLQVRQMRRVRGNKSGGQLPVLQFLQETPL
ncbi:hypothetical protein IMSAGC014_00270 [Bacteroidaceae bacterium]|nr:hypothetical protein IMSAGC014_00270 [Bacteroidaceae bacterium]